MADSPLADWIQRSATSQRRLCRESGISEPHLCLFLQGKRRLSIESAKRISAATHGNVTVWQLLPDIAALVADEESAA